MRLMLRVLGALIVLLAPPGAGAEDPAARARDLACRLQDALDPDQQGRVTMAVAILDNGKILAATSEDGDRRRSPVRAILEQEGIEWVDGMPRAHAEQKIIRYVQSGLFLSKRKILVIAAGRPICAECEQAIRTVGAKPASACRSGRSY